MVDKMKLQIYWPQKERRFCYSYQPLIDINSDVVGRNRKKYRLLNPASGQNLYLYTDDNQPYCTLIGNWRKWYFGKKKALHQDLNKKQFYEVIKLISELTGISIGAILSANIKNVELGFITKLKREHDLFIPSLKRYGKLRRMTVEAETVKFIGTKKTFKCYDKGIQVLPTIASKRATKVILKHICFMRSELELKSISATEYKFLKSPFDIYKNWDYLLDELVDIILNRIERVDLFSNDLDLTQVAMTYNELQKLLTYNGIKNVGFDNVIILVNKRSKERSKISEHRKKIYEIYHSHKSASKEILIQEILERIYLRAESLKSKSS